MPAHVASQTWLPLMPFSSFFLFLFSLVPSILPTSPFPLSFTQKFTHLLDDTRQKIKWIRIKIFQIFPRISADDPSIFFYCFFPEEREKYYSK